MLTVALTLLSLSAAPDLSSFASLPEDPPPKEIVRGQHYWVSNEERPELFRADLEKMGGGGVYLGVGAEQNFVFMGWAKPDVAVLMDFDGAIPDLHRLFATVFKRAATKEAFVDAFTLAKLPALIAGVNEDIADEAVRARVLDVVKEARGNIRVHAERIRKGFVQRKVITYLNDDATYAFVRKMFVDNRVFIVRGDLTALSSSGQSVMQSVGTAAKRAGLPVHAIYLSNAEQYFDYTDGYRRNVLALPFDEKGLVLRTISWARWGFAKDSNAYHYDIQSGLSFQSWVADDNTKNVKAVLDAAERKYGISHLVTPPAAPALPHVVEPGAAEATTPPLPIVAPVTPELVTTTAPATSEPMTPLANAPAVIGCDDVKLGDMSCVPGGPFLRGTNDPHKISENARPQSTVWVQTFFMDKVEVTYAAYKECEHAGKCKKAGPNYLDFDAPKQPITGVSWYDAKQFCEAHGKRLPTEAEWEKAARGVDGRMYPWGNQPATCDRAIIETDAGKSCGVKQRSQDFADVGRPEPVGSRPATLYGLFDMAGNSWEWVADWVSPSWKECGDACAGVDPKGPCGGAEPCAGHHERVVRGGSWFWAAQYATTYHRRSHPPSNSPMFHHFGFRCAVSVDGAKALAGAASNPRSIPCASRRRTEGKS